VRTITGVSVLIVRPFRIITCLVAEIETSAKPGLLCNGAAIVDITPGITTPVVSVAAAPSAVGVGFPSRFASQAVPKLATAAIICLESALDVVKGAAGQLSSTLAGIVVLAAGNNVCTHFTSIIAEVVSRPKGRSTRGSARLTHPTPGQTAPHGIGTEARIQFLAFLGIPWHARCAIVSVGGGIQSQCIPIHH